MIIIIPCLTHHEIKKIVLNIDWFVFSYASKRTWVMDFWTKRQRFDILLLVLNKLRDDFFSLSSFLKFRFVLKKRRRSKRCLLFWGTRWCLISIITSVIKYHNNRQETFSMTGTGPSWCLPSRTSWQALATRSPTPLFR